MAYAFKEDGEWQEIANFFRAHVGDDIVTYNADALQSHSVEELATLGVKPITEASPPPTNSRTIGTEIVDENNAPVRRWIFNPYSPQEAHDIMWARAKTIRATYTEGTLQVELNGQTYCTDTDTDAREFLLGYVQLASLSKAAGQPYSETWTMHDNSDVQLDADAMISLGVQVGRYIGAVYSNARSIRKALDAGLASNQSAGTIFLYDVASGYPQIGTPG
jgi:hypothetical protein